MAIIETTTRMTYRYLMAKSKSDLAHICLEQADTIDKIMKTFSELQRESLCPVCRGISEANHPCEECKGTGLCSVAYDTCRIHFKLLEEDCEKAIANLNRFARCTIGVPTPDDVEWAKDWLKNGGLKANGSRW